MSANKLGVYITKAEIEGLCACAAKTGGRYVLNAVAVDAMGGTLRLTATDGYRFVRRHFPNQALTWDGVRLVDPAALRSAARAARARNWSASVSEEGIVVGTEVVPFLVDPGQYPDCKKFIYVPSRPDVVCVTLPSSFLDALETIDAKVYPLTQIMLRSGNLSLHARTECVDWAASLHISLTAPCGNTDKTGPLVGVANLQAVLRAMRQCYEITMIIGDNDEQVTFTAGEDLALVMPVRA